MKNKNYFILFTIIIAMCSCNSKSSSIDYLPCMVEEDDDWGFVNGKGEVFCKNAFENRPTEVREGIFFVLEDYAYAMYQFDAKKPKLLMEDIVRFGLMNEGLVPVCRMDSHIEIVNSKGKTKFKLDKIEGQDIVSCAPLFHCGYLIVQILEKNGEKSYGIVDKSGKVVLSPRYQDIDILGDNLFYVTDYEDGEKRGYFIDNKGKKQAQWNNNLRIETSSNEYIAAALDGNYYVYDLKGNEVLKCPSKVHGISQIKNNYIVFVGKKGKYYNEYGVMDVKGETIIPAKYNEIFLVNNGILVNKFHDRKVETLILSNNGELISENDFTDFASLDGFGNLGRTKHMGDYILDEQFNLINETAFYEIGIYFGNISDYYHEKYFYIANAQDD